MAAQATDTSSSEEEIDYTYYSFTECGSDFEYEGKAYIMPTLLESKCCREYANLLEGLATSSYIKKVASRTLNSSSLSPRKISK